MLMMKGKICSPILQFKNYPNSHDSLFSTIPSNPQAHTCGQVIGITE